MGVIVNIHKTHRQHTNGLSKIEVEGDTVGQCLDHLVKHYPALKEVLFEKRDKLRNNMEIYVNLESAYPGELAKPVRNGDEIHITVMLAGG
jgi:molybdopterin converting factor small subunit